MADEVTAKSSGNEGDFAPHPAGTHVARCVDTINLGQKVDQYGDNPAKLVSKVVLVFRTAEKRHDGKPFDIGQEFTLSMGTKSNLRRFLENWRGKPYSDEQAEEGVPLHKLVGQAALLSVAHKKSGAGRIYGYIATVMPVPKGMQPPEETEYVRADYWGERAKEYAEGVRKFKAQHAPPPEHDDEAFEATAPDDDDLPF